VQNAVFALRNISDQLFADHINQQGRQATGICIFFHCPVREMKMFSFFCCIFYSVVEIYGYSEKYFYSTARSRLCRGVKIFLKNSGILSILTYTVFKKMPVPDFLRKCLSRIMMHLKTIRI